MKNILSATDWHSTGGARDARCGNNHESPGRLDFQEVDEPSLTPTEALVRISAMDAGLEESGKKEEPVEDLSLMAQKVLDAR